MSRAESGFTYGADIDGLCERVTYILNDAEKDYQNTTWEKPFLQAIACDAIFMLASVKPDLFKADTIKIELKPETYKQVIEDCEECELLLSFVCFETEDGNLIPSIDTEYSMIQRSALLPAPCINCDGVMGRVPSIQVAMSPDSLDTFGINPMFPADEKLFAVVRCRNLKKYYDGTESMPDGVRASFPALTQLMLHLALSGDRGEGGLAELGNRHFDNFVSSIGLSFRQAEFLQAQIERR